MFGEDSTVLGIEYQFRAIKANAARQRKAFEAGIDPQTLGICSLVAQPNRKSKSSSTAEKFGEGTTGKAISTRFERMRKEEAWNLSISTNSDAAAAAPKGTPRKPRTPGSGAGRKKTPKTPKKVEDDEDEDSEIESPSKIKKENLKKTVAGRVTKAAPRAAKAAIKSYEESDAETEFMDADTGAVKTEEGMMDWGHTAAGEEHAINNDYDYGNGNTGYGDVDDGHFYDEA
ncbi:hypothetical protein CJF30_00002004 [Rutstroemia sp. NJR-2017a BBW]|nr:hypothetical protein CJF30_00002004 [Rutstroemia sp. NJR-2017a BBW]